VNDKRDSVNDYVSTTSRKQCHSLAGRPVNPRGPGRTGMPSIAYIAIHGVGRQEDGKTAEAMSASFIDGTSRVGATFVDDPQPQRGSVRSGQLTTAAKTTQHVRFIDAWWDQDVSPPRLPLVLRWMLRVTPFMVLTTIAAWATDLLVAGQTSTRWDRRLFTLISGASILVAFVLTPLVVIVLVVVNILAVLRPHAYPVLNNIVLSVFGDAWLYRSEELDSGVIPRLTALVEEAKSTSDAVILVGHSQGAEIGRRLALATPVDACVWVGGALTPLATLRTLRNSPALPWVLWVYVLLVPLITSTVIAHVLRTTGDALGTIWEGFTSILETTLGDTSAAQRGSEASDRMFALAFADLPAMLIFLLFIVIAAVVLRWAARWPADLLHQPLCPVFEVKSLADPVCFGAQNDQSIVRYVPIRSGMAVFREHVAYFQKPDTGIALLEPLIGVDGRPAPYEPEFRWSTYALSIASMIGLIIIANLAGSAILRAIGW